MSLFKYMRREHLKAFVARGTVRLGTLYEYRNVEQYGPVIGDTHEGEQLIDFSVPGGGEVKMSGNTAEAKYLKFLFPDLTSEHVIRFAASSVLRRVSQCPDMYLYCTTTRCDPQVMGAFGYDSCLEIVDPERFFMAISRVIRHKARFEGASTVQYQSRAVSYTIPRTMHPAMMKGPEYSAQCEARALWLPVKNPTGALIVDVPSAIKFCRTINP